MKITLDEAVDELSSARLVFSRANDRHMSALDRLQSAQYNYNDAWETYVKYGHRALQEAFHQKSAELDFAYKAYYSARSYLKISQVRLKKAERVVKKLQKKVDKENKREAKRKEKEEAEMFWFK